jgi:hypothetical protein
VKHLTDHLYSFIEELRTAKFNIGVAQFINAQNLILALAKQGKLPENLADLKSLLAPILCHSSEEQEEFQWRFDNWLQRLEVVKPQPVTTIHHRKFSLLRWMSLFLITIIISIIPNNIQLPEFTNIIYTWALLAIPLILIFNLWWRRRELDSFQISKPRLAIEQLPTVQTSEPSLQDIALIAQFLRQQVPIASKELNLSQTLEQGIKAVGNFTPIYNSIARIPEYIVLIEKVSFNDHQAEFFDHLIQQLRQQGITITRYFFKANPYIGYKTQAQISPLLLTEISKHSSENRLIIISEGNNPITNELLNWIFNSSDWSNCILLTLDDIWNKKSLQIDQFYISSIDEIPQQTKDLQVDREWHFKYPRYLYEYPSRWLEANAPEPTVQTELLTQIQIYLGKDNYQCLCATAAYPELHWALTLHLANQFNCSNITKLIRLPWYRQAYMPDWLRQRLLQDLSTQKIRAAFKTVPLAAKDNTLTDKLYIKVMGKNWLIKLAKFSSYITSQVYRLLTPFKVSFAIITLVFIITNLHLLPNLKSLSTPNVIPAAAPPAAAPTITRHETNFIVLIQDTVEIDSVAKDLISTNLPKLLFTGTTPYRPTLDYLSLIFVNSEFKWQNIKQGQDQTAFSNTLNKLMSQNDRAKGTNYSHFLAKMTVLPYVEQQLKDISPFSRTILIMLDKQQSIQQQPNEITKKVKQFFQFQDKTNIVLKSAESDNILNYKLTEISPNSKQLQDILDYPKQVTLDRIAISNEKLIQITNKQIQLKIAASQYLQPETIEIFLNQDINHLEIPNSIAACIKSKICQRQTDGTILIPFIDKFDSQILTNLELKFKLKFNYKIPEIYTHQWLNSDDHTIKIDTIKPLVIPAHSFFSNIFPETILDNKTLLELYDPLQDATKGLNQQTAKNRILQPREQFNRQILITASIFAIIQLSLFALLFYEFYYRRRYHLKLNWQALNNIEIDLNTASKQLLGTIVIKHDKRKPDTLVEINLNYDNNLFTEHGILLTETKSIPLGFKGEELQTKIIETLTNTLTLYLFIDTEAINTYNTANNQPITFDKLEIEINIAGKTVLKRKLEFNFQLKNKL